MCNNNDIYFMKLALSEAEIAAKEDEVPVGAVLVSEEGKVLARAHNRTITDCDPTAHAEVLVIRAATKIIRNYRLLKTVLYVTIEPCIMCMGTIILARISRVVYGAEDARWGAAGSLYDLSKDRRLNHTVEVTGGVLQEPCRQLIRDFFRARRRYHDQSRIRFLTGVDHGQHSNRGNSMG